MAEGGADGEVSQQWFVAAVMKHLFVHARQHSSVWHIAVTWHDKEKKQNALAYFSFRAKQGSYSKLSNQIIRDRETVSPAD